jgi:hypothetical protein
MPHRRASALPPKCHHTTAVPKYISGRTSYLQVRLEFHRLPQVIPAFCNRPGFGPPRTYSARFTLLMVRSPGFGSPACDSYRPFGLAFASAPPVLRLNLATYNNSLAHSTKGTPSPLKGGSDRPEAHGFRICFTPLLGVLFTIPSRYWFTIGRLQYLALGCGHPCFPPDFACPAVLTFITTGPQQLRLRVSHPLRTALPIPFASPLLTRVRPGRRTRNHVQPPCSSGSCLIRCNGFGLLPVRSPLLRESSLFLGVR